MINILEGFVSCGSFNNIPEGLVRATQMIYKMMIFAVPILLILFGMIDMGKSIIATKEEKIKEHQKMFGKRIIAAVLVILVYYMVHFVLGIVLEGDKTEVFDCVDLFLRGR